MQNEPLLSVIIPVYNVAQYLERCLNSIIHSTYSNLQIICVDDGSTDGGGEILDRYARQDARITVVHQPNGGLSAARNTGYALAEGEYLATVDSDDRVHCRYFEYAVRGLLETKADMVMVQYREVRGDEPDEALPEPEFVPVSVSELIHTRHGKEHVWDKIWRTEYVKNHRYEPVPFAEDLVFNLQVYVIHKPVAVQCSLPLYNYYLRDNSLVRTTPNRKKLPCCEALLNSCTELNGRRYAGLLLMETIKRMLAYRFRSVYDEEEREVFAAYRQLLLKAEKLLPKASLPIHQKLALRAMIHIPMLYTLFQCAVDPAVRSHYNPFRKLMKGVSS